ncbi:MAG: hypothetical protein ACD_39C00202G0001 [uncultured bacterium]|nr:MAG: hypothetical protein ACD_39C00202G0001 [uncultured bacterium]
MKPADLSANRQRKSPIPAATPSLTQCGIALTIASRNLKTVISMNIIPETNTAPSAVCHGIFMPMTMLKVKKALIPMPGASAKGRFATRPMRILDIEATSMVAVKTPENGIPAFSRIIGLTASI